MRFKGKSPISRKKEEYFKKDNKKFYRQMRPLDIGKRLL